MLDLWFIFCLNFTDAFVGLVGRLYLPKATEVYRRLPKAAEGHRRLPKADVGDVVRRRQGRIQGGGSLASDESPYPLPSETQKLCKRNLMTFLGG